VIATDVGACRELIEGREADDQALGPSGFVTRVATPKETAAALVRLARDPQLRRRLGAAGSRRVAAHYQRRDMLSAYRALYAFLTGSTAGGEPVADSLESKEVAEGGA
jgi:glycosyltransferase involved in cell wall biosynthesis